MNARGLKRMVQNTVPTRNEAYRRFKTCDRKRTYADMDAGWNAVRSIRANGNDHFPDFELRPYECGYCGNIHVGHSNTPRLVEQRMREQDKLPDWAIPGSGNIIGDRTGIEIEHGTRRGAGKPLCIA